MKRMVSDRSLFRLILILSWQVSAFLSSAQSSLDSLQHIGEVVVSAHPYMEAIPPQKLSGRQLESLNSHSVADAIRYFSGTQLKDYGGVGGLKTVNIRSMGTNQVGVFYNGIQLGNAQNGQVDLGKFSLDNVEAISLYNGQRSRNLQPARDFSSASSVYITTRKPLFTGGKNANVRGTLRAGSFDLVNPSFLLEYKISDRLSLSVNNEWINSSGKYKVHYRRVFPHTTTVAYDTVAVRQNGDINASRLEASLHGAMEKGAWTIHAYNYSSDRGVPGAVVNNVWRRGERMGGVNSFLQGSFRYDFSPAWKSLFNAKYAADYTHFEHYDYSLYPTNNTFRQKEAYFSAANLFPLNTDWDASLSYDFQWNTLDADFQRLDDYDVFPYPTRCSHWLAAGVAFNRERWKAQANLLATVVRETVKAYGKPDDKNVLTPAVFASYQLLPEEDLRLHAFYKKIFRVATFNERYYVEMISSDIKPEYATQYNLGLRYANTFGHAWLRRIDAQAEVYYNEVDDKIICTPKSPMFKWTTYNLGRVEIRGVDVSLGNTFQWGEAQLDTRLQYTWQQARDVTDRADSFYGHQIPYIPWHSGSVVGSANYRRWTLHYSFIYAGERYSQSDNIVYNHVQPWYTHDASLVGRWKVKNRSLKVVLEVNNLLGQDYEVVFNYPMPGRNYRATVSVEL